MTVQIKRTIGGLRLAFHIWISRIRRRLRRSVSRTAFVLVPAPYGSVGDAAMVEGLHVLSRRCGIRLFVLCVAGEEDVARWATAFDWVGALSFARFFDKRSVRPLIEWSKTAHLADHLWVCGADVIDGKYSLKDSLGRIELLGIACRLGMRASVLGCSFNESPPAELVRALGELPATVDLMARDSDSQERLSSAAARPVRLVADLAFSISPDGGSEEFKAVKEWVARSTRSNTSAPLVLGVNVAGIGLTALGSAGRMRLETSFVVAIGEIARAYPEARFLLIPHDFRPPPNDDLVGLRRIASQLHPSMSDRVRLIENGSCPRAVKAIAGICDHVITCRMHLAIAALGSCTPVAGLAYQDKFAGLMRQFGLKGALMNVQRALQPQALVEFWTGSIESRYSQRKSIDECLEVVRARSPDNIGS